MQSNSGNSVIIILELKTKQAGMNDNMGRNSTDVYIRGKKTKVRREWQPQTRAKDQDQWLPYVGCTESRAGGPRGVC